MSREVRWCTIASKKSVEFPLSSPDDTSEFLASTFPTRKPNRTEMEIDYLLADSSSSSSSSTTLDFLRLTEHLRYHPVAFTLVASGELLASPSSSSSVSSVEALARNCIATDDCPLLKLYLRFDLGYAGALVLKSALAENTSLEELSLV
eukprot:CAMPEP_0116563200 /NCGR_PEP_ID=MMETSP0397-20121206/12597_1 /TAXON_ID=216820 /ORGANISM="Cyclophora tenuis, Strain ECT3854" /LENGTH=148 /DNA_ID=CAMNT_0004089609 /DNA_START=60 /DNA_END=504 /DNA_ORIENTATION=-